MVRLSLLGICLSVLMFSACGGSPAPAPNNNSASAAEAQAAAQAALDRMDGKQPAAQSPSSASTATPTANTPAAQQGTVVNTSSTKPNWVDSVDSVYSRAQYVAAVGQAADRTMAERNALANLTAIFGQSIKANQTIIDTYMEGMQNGVTAGYASSLSVENNINIQTSMDSLVGAEIKEVWFDSRSTYYAVAVMEKAKTTQIYNDMINSNQSMISNLITMSQAEKNTLDGFSRYQFAATIADINITYGNVLQVIGAAPRQDLVRGDSYRIEAQNITKTIPVGISVKNDKAGRIQGAFAKALSDLGFRSGGNNARYMLGVDVTVSPAEFPNNTNKFSRMELDARFTDDGATVLPYNFSIREGHATQAEAENRVYAAGEKKIGDEYAKLLNDYLSRLLPQRR